MILSIKITSDYKLESHGIYLAIDINVSQDYTFFENKNSFSYPKQHDSVTF